MRRAAAGIDLRERVHDDTGSAALFADMIRRTVARGGSVLIPAFAVDRTEVILVELARLVREDEIPDVPVLVGSPTAPASPRVCRQAIAAARPEVRPGLVGADDPFDPGHLAELRAAQQSMTERRT